MANPVLGRFDEPTSIRQLTRGRGWNSELVGFLLPFARQDYLYHEWDFCETAITDDPNAMWAVSNSGGTSAASFATKANAENGVIEGDTGTSDNGGISLVADAINLNADKNPGLHVIMQIDDVSEAGMEAGFSDAKTDEDTLAITDVDTPTMANGATDGGFIVYDTDTTTQKGAAFVTGGATDGDAVVTLGSTAAANPFADNTDFDLVVQLYANAGYAVIDHNAVLSGGLSTGPDADVLMRPSIVVVTRNTTAKFPEIDLIRLWRNRV